MAEPTEMPFGMCTCVGPRRHVLDRGYHWHGVADTIALSMCVGDVAVLSNYFDHVFFSR